MKKLFVLNIIISFLFLGCEKHNTKTITDSDLGYDYYPTEIGSYVIYEVKEIVHDNPSNILDTFEYRIKEVVDSEFTNDAGEKTLRIERFIKNKSDKHYDSLDWSIKDVWVANKTISNFTKTEENFKYTKLIFPIKEGGYWDMNVGNIENTYYLEYQDVHQPLTINNTSFDSTITIYHDGYSLISDNSLTEIYAKGIGLVYKKYNDYRFISTTSSEIETGTEMIVNYISHN